jgi:hypothetical protein
MEILLTRVPHRPIPDSMEKKTVAEMGFSVRAFHATLPTA